MIAPISERIMTSIIKRLLHNDLDIWTHPLTVGQVRPMVETLAIPESTYYAPFQDKSDHNTWHRQNIEILTSNSESTWKTGPGDILCVIFECESNNSFLGNNHRNGSNTSYLTDFKMPSSNIPSTKHFALSQPDHMTNSILFWIQNVVSMLNIIYCRISSKMVPDCILIIVTPI